MFAWYITKLVHACCPLCLSTLVLSSQSRLRLGHRPGRNVESCRCGTPSNQPHTERLWARVDPGNNKKETTARSTRVCFRVQRFDKVGVRFAPGRQGLAGWRKYCHHTVIYKHTQHIRCASRWHSLCRNGTAPDSHLKVRQFARTKADEGGLFRR